MLAASMPATRQATHLGDPWRQVFINPMRFLLINGLRFALRVQTFRKFLDDLSLSLSVSFLIERDTDARAFECLMLTDKLFN